MKKILLIVLSIVLGLSVIIVTIWSTDPLPSIGPQDPIILTDEESTLQQQEYNNKFNSLNLSGFEAKTLNDQIVTSDIFKDSQVTMVNIFATWCSPCVAEMPDIAKLYKDLPKNSNIIGICIDAGDDKDSLKLAKKIIQKSNVAFNVLIPDEVLEKKLVSLVDVLPTTLYIDSNGNIIGDVHNSGHSENDYHDQIIKRLESVQASR